MPLAYRLAHLYKVTVNQKFLCNYRSWSDIFCSTEVIRLIFMSFA